MRITSSSGSTAVARDWFKVVAAVRLFLIRDGRALLLRPFNTGL